MYREKHLANIDKVLKDFLSKKSERVADKNRIAYSEEMEEAGQIKKIAFDVFRVENDPYNSLWTIDDFEGKKYLIRSSDPQYREESRGSWTAVSNYDKDSVTLAYNNVPIANFTSGKYKFSPDDIINFKLALLDSVDDETFVKEVLLEQPSSKREALLSEFPEFHKIIKG